MNVTTAGNMASMSRGTEEHTVQLCEEITADESRSRCARFQHGRSVYADMGDEACISLLCL